jgi:hypothetical protein
MAWGGALMLVMAVLAEVARRAWCAEAARRPSRRRWSRAVCKPGSVSSGGPEAVAIYLGRRLPGASSDRNPRAWRATCERPPIWSCSERGLPGRPVTRPPVGSYPTISPLPACAAGGVISVALSFGSPRLGVTQRPALWSPDFPPHRPRAMERPPDRLDHSGFYPRPAAFPPLFAAFSCSSIARLARASAPRFRSRGTWLTDESRKRPSSCRASRCSGCRSAFLTR